MAQSPLNIAFVAADTTDAKEAAKRLAALYGNCRMDSADIVVALGGDGFMLHCLHGAITSGHKIYGMNCGSVGFLMNSYEEANLNERLANAVEDVIVPLEMIATDMDGVQSKALSLNEVSLFRQSHQAAKIAISVDGKQRLDELICDGVMVATPAGSTAYNLSAHGPILPLDAQLLALTPVSAFRPRRWRGALLPDRSVVEFNVREASKRPVNAVADHWEVKSVASVQVRQAPDAQVSILFDADHGWNERILTEQFKY